MPCFSLHEGPYELNSWTAYVESVDPGITEFVGKIVAEMHYDSVRVGESADKTKMGKKVLDPKVMNEYFKTRFAEREYFAKKIPTYSVDSPRIARILRDIPFENRIHYLRAHGIKFREGFMECDFTNEKGLLFEIQFGKYPFGWWDVEKSQDFITRREAKAACIILPMDGMLMEMNTGPGCYESLMTMLVERYAEERISTPFMVHGIAVDHTVDNNDCPSFVRKAKERAEPRHNGQLFFQF